jgi:hypothetical protein
MQEAEGVRERLGTQAEREEEEDREVGAVRAAGLGRQLPPCI